MRVGLFNVKYSGNLGDGMLSECLEAELRRSSPAGTVQSFDLAGRSSYGQGGRFRGAALALLNRLPTRVRQGAVELVLGRSLHRRSRPAWRQALGRLDAVVVGGGNLFGDADLNFPLKIDAAMAEVRAAGLPAAVFAVGVSDNWSSRGEALFRRALAGSSLVYASVREPRSAAIWDRRLGASGVISAQIAHDPGLLVSLHVPRQAADATLQRPLVGLGLTHPAALRYHADERSVSGAELTAWFVALVRGCLAQGWRLTVFTNGSSEDDAYLRQVRPTLAGLDPGDKIAFMPRFRSPSELARFISGLDLVMAHRLHANVAAYSYRVPQVGFSWDAKLASFLARVGRADFIRTAGIDPPTSAVGLARRALQEGIDPDRHDRVLTEAREDVARLAAALRGAVLARACEDPDAGRELTAS